MDDQCWICKRKESDKELINAHLEEHDTASGQITICSVCSSLVEKLSFYPDELIDARIEEKLMKATANINIKFD